MKQKFSTRRLVTLAMFCAIAYAVTLVFHIKVSFLTFDAKDAVVCLAAMLFGPGAGVIIAGVVATVESLSVGMTGFWGWLMDFASTAVFALVASAIYRYKRTMRAALAGLGVAVLSTTALMLLLNILVTPIYMSVPTDTVLSMIPKLLFPFNLIKSLLNAALVLLLYKPLSTALKKAHVMGQGTGGSTAGALPRWQRIAFPIAAVLLAVLCVVILFVVLDGSFSLIDTPKA